MAMATAPTLLRRLLAIVKLLLLSARRIARNTLFLLLRQVLLLFKLLRSRLVQAGLYAKGRKPGGKPLSLSEAQPPIPTTGSATPAHSSTSTTTTAIAHGTAAHDDHEALNTTLISPSSSTITLAETIHDDASIGKLADSTIITIGTNDSDKETIPLDNAIACSLFPYLNPSGSRVSLQANREAARSAHDLGVSSRIASRSMQHLPMRRSPEALSLREYGSEEGIGEGFTIGVEKPQSPVTPHRRASMSMPQLSSPECLGYELGIARQNASSPDSILSEVAIPAGDVATVDHIFDEPKLDSRNIFPIIPEYFQREPKDTRYLLKPMTMDFRDASDPEDWLSIVHPEGFRYFYNEKKKVVTDANLYDPQFLNRITRNIKLLGDYVHANDIRLPEDYTLAMDLTMKDGEIVNDYYFADHEKKIVFFLDELQLESNLLVWNQIKGVTSLAHIHCEMEAQYWMHGVYYPNTVPVTHKMIACLRDTVLHYIGDLTTSPYSTSPYTSADLDRILGQLNSIEKIVGHPCLGASNMCCRLMNSFARARFLHWHGVPQARLNRDQSVYGKKPSKTLLIKILSPILFSAPDIQLANLERLWVDEIMHGAVWLEAIKKLSEEWQEFVLYSTVLLNANVGFLAIESVDTEENMYRSPIQVACYLSIVSSIGSIIIGLLLMRQNRRQCHATADEAGKFLKDRSSPTVGLETLAILYSLPYALLLWGMASFLAAIAWNCFDNSNLSTCTIMACAWFAFAVLVIWCTWMGWTKTDHDSKTNESNKTTDSAEKKSDTTNEKGGGAKSSSVSMHFLSRLHSRRSALSTPPPTRPASRASVVSSLPTPGEKYESSTDVRSGSDGSGRVLQNLVEPLRKWFQRSRSDSQQTLV